MKTGIKKAITSFLLATLWIVIVVLLNLVEIGGGSITYFLAMAVFGLTSGRGIVILTEKIFEKLEKRKAALAKKKIPPVVSKEYHCKKCGEQFTYNNPTNTPKYCSYCSGELAETTEAGKILSELFYSVEHEPPIKTRELCKMCEYWWDTHNCKQTNCGDCENKTKHKSCLCLTIKHGDPCPYFKKFEERESDVRSKL